MKQEIKYKRNTPHRKNLTFVRPKFEKNRDFQNSVTSGKNFPFWLKYYNSGMNGMFVHCFI